MDPTTLLMELRGAGKWKVISGKFLVMGASFHTRGQKQKATHSVSQRLPVRSSKSLVALR